ncbi:DUF3606 domain-containing protein [Chelativorans sp. AA-79]|uniref:DUF3606 domain-containing protein n=1 Tax=Chelativorans sp. AA-79 TaxID=3028735 RepID=UPI0023FA321D|nr:DUF3606 domain-containing protein [Chelativorans sp. AA-79]WEX07383.1 DUF3606 domain-containing protein [Chelativorans sp. AA-79]
MADDKSKRGGPDRKRVAGEQPYEVGYFARKHQISIEDARRIVNKYGPSRDKANTAAAKLKKK